MLAMAARRAAPALAVARRPGPLALARGLRARPAATRRPLARFSNARWPPNSLAARSLASSAQQPGDGEGAAGKSEAGVKPADLDRDTIKRLVELARPEAKLIGASMSTLFVTSSISLLFPMAIGKVLDLSLTGGAGLSPTWLAGGLLGLFTVQGGLIVARSAMLSVASERLIARFRKQLFAAILAQELEFFDRTRTGGLVNRLSADTQLVQKSLTSNMVQGLRSVFMAGGGTLMLFYTSPMLALVSLSVIPPVGLGARRFGRYMKKRQAEVQDALAETSTVAEEVIANARTVRQFAAEPLEAAKYNARIDSAYRRACEVGLSTAWYDGGVNLAANMSLVAVLGYGGSLVMNNELTGGTLTAFLMYSLYVGFNITNLSNIYSDLMRGVGASTRIFEIIDKVPQMPSSITSARNGEAGASADPASLPDSMTHSLLDEMAPTSSTKAPFGANMFGLVPSAAGAPYATPFGTEVQSRSGYDDLAESVKGKLATPPIHGDIRLEGVHFRYPLRDDVPILQGLDLSLQHGTTLALVGASGSGKSTIAALLMRLYDPQQGVVKVDGLDVREMDPHWLRMHIGVVAQEPVLFSGSIEENIRYGNMQAPLEQVVEAARAAGAWGFIEKFPEQLRTRVGERGMQLSGGQKQRIAIARAMLKDPPIVLLDEATSALDAESEYHVQAAIERMMKGRSVITIAHRLSTMRAADRIAVLEGGKIVQEGSFDDLLEEESKFEQLIRRQL